MPPEISLPAAQGGAQPGIRTLLHSLVVGGVLASFAIMLVLARTHNVNWDEFYFLSLVHAHLDGRLDRPMQTFFVHLFGWLGAVPGDEMQQIFIARLVMLALFAATAASVFRIAAALTDTRAAWVATLAFVTSGFVIGHGASFRADPIAAFLLTSALALVLTTQMRLVQIVATAVLCALAVLVTIKSVLFMPAFLGALIWRMENRAVFWRIIGAAVLVPAIVIPLFLWHASGIDVAPGKELGANAQNALTTTLLGGRILPRAREILVWLPLSFGLIALAWMGLRAARNPRMLIVLLLLAAPVLSIVIYRNAFPYFFPFIVPTLAVVAAFGAARLRRTPTALFVLVLLMMLSGGAQSILSLGEDNRVQRATIAEVHRLMPTPVPYIDRNGMVSQFEKVGFFMSTWGLLNYRAAAEPVFADLIADRAPPLLIANSTALRLALAGHEFREHSLDLLPEDAAALRETYTHYAGPIWLAGQRVTATGGVDPVQIAVAGDYRLIADAPVIVDGQEVSPEGVVSLDVGVHDVAASAGSVVTLIWDTDAPADGDAIPPGKLYHDFWHF